MKANYGADMRLDVKVPMRDGVGVFADIGAGDISDGAHTPYSNNTEVPLQRSGGLGIGFVRREWGCRSAD